MSYLEMKLRNDENKTSTNGICLNFGKFLTDLDFSTDTEYYKWDEYPIERYHEKMSEVLEKIDHKKQKLPLLISISLDEEMASLNSTFCYQFIIMDNPNTSFDCSGLTQWCYGKAGISLPRTAQMQYDATQHIPLSQAKAGDLVFFHSTYNAGSYVTHVGIYVGNNQMYHAGDPIGYTDLNNSYWQQHLICAGRIKQ